MENKENTIKAFEEDFYDPGTILYFFYCADIYDENLSVVGTINGVLTATDEDILNICKQKVLVNVISSVKDYALEEFETTADKTAFRAIVNVLTLLDKTEAKQDD